jgi:sensor histidine kinase YesM
MASIMSTFAKAKLRTKIISIVIAICLFALLGMSTASYITIKKVSQYSERTNTVLGVGAADSASGALLEQAHNFLMVIARQQAVNCNAMLNTFKFDVELLEGVVTDIFNNPQYYSLGRTVINPSETVKGIYSGTYILPETVPMTEKIRQELNLLSNLGLLLPTLTNNPDIIEFYVGMESGLFYNYTPLIYAKPKYDPRTRLWYTQAVAHPGTVIYTEVYEDALGSGLVATVSKAVFDKRGKLLGVVALDIMLDNYKKLLMETRILKSGYAFIINNEGKYIFHPDMDTQDFQPTIPQAQKGSETAEGFQRMMNGETGFFTVEENGGQFFIAFSPISVTGWSVGVTVNENELLSALGSLSTQLSLLTGEAKKNIERMSGQAIITFIVIFTAVAVMVVFLSFFLSFLISKPIQKLTEEVVNIGAGHLDARIKGSYNDEFDKIKDAVNSMAADIKTYMEEKLQTERKLAESRISIMLSQIQPHFLYNALAVISTLCGKNPAEAKKATVNFSNYLRGNMNLLERTEPIPFENELNHTISFMNLEQAMYGEALKVIYDIQTKNFKLPALTMQPIVENAVKHGIGKKEGGGTVTISTKETDRCYMIIVTDDGAGFEQDKINDDGQQHIGINNVRLRLSAQCGGSLEIESKIGEGTTAKIIIPKREKYA